MSAKLLFVTRRRESYWGAQPETPKALSSGLSNSVRFMVDMLNRRGVHAVVEEALDNNCLDRLISKHHPTHVILEAFWVVPGKLDQLKPLHPRVRWIVRNHSEMPFLANEGIALEWTLGYVRRGVEVMSNSPRAQGALKAVATAHGLPEALLTYGPNVYPASVPTARSHLRREARHVDIACFGAIRPLKNHLSQAVAAISFGDAIGKRVRFHVNASRVEGKAEPVLKNLRAVFDGSMHQLVEQPWLDHADFLSLMDRMEIAMQVSFTETFNIVTADAVARSVPVVVNDVPWIGSYAEASPTSIESMADKLLEIWDESEWQKNARLHRQRRDLLNYTHEAEEVWATRFPTRRRFAA